jgi:hypothetical protein
MTDDLVKRLRESCYVAFDDGTNDYSTAIEAADRIEQLELALRQIEYLDRPQVRGLPRRIEIGDIVRAALEKSDD